MRYLVRTQVKPGKEEELLESIQDAHARSKCRHENGEEYWACGDCDCTERLEERLERAGERFLTRLRETSGQRTSSTA